MRWPAHSQVWDWPLRQGRHIGHGQIYRHEALLSWSRWMEKRSLESPDFKADTINVRLQL